MCLTAAKMGLSPCAAKNTGHGHTSLQIRRRTHASLSQSKRGVKATVSADLGARSHCGEPILLIRSVTRGPRADIMEADPVGGDWYLVVPLVFKSKRPDSVHYPKNAGNTLF